MGTTDSESKNAMDLEDHAMTHGMAYGITELAVTEMCHDRGIPT
jgi:hypothetical protein